MYARLFYTRLCSSRARWPQAPNFCSWVTRKSQIFHTNHMLGSLDFTGSENWAPFNVPYSTALFEELARFNLAGGGTFLERRPKESGHF